MVGVRNINKYESVYSQVCMCIICNIFGIGTQQPKLEDLNNRVVPWWAPQWKQLGEQLKVGDHLIRIIEHDHPNDCETCCSKMLTKWLDNTPTASWEDLTTAVNDLSSYGM